jgi:hypothetical protein
MGPARKPLKHNNLDTALYESADLDSSKFSQISANFIAYVGLSDASKKSVEPLLTSIERLQF